MELRDAAGETTLVCEMARRAGSAGRVYEVGRHGVAREASAINEQYSVALAG